jgi:hypothetical protein
MYSPVVDSQTSAQKKTMTTKMKRTTRIRFPVRRYDRWNVTSRLGFRPRSSCLWNRMPFRCVIIPL